jgi:hypothetical protein
VTADIVEDANVGVRQRGDCLRLTLEAPTVIRIRSGVGQKNLDCDDAVQTRVASLVHLAHTTGTDEGDDFVRTETRTSRE